MFHVPIIISSATTFSSGFLPVVHFFDPALVAQLGTRTLFNRATSEPGSQVRPVVTRLQRAWEAVLPEKPHRAIF